MQLHPRHGAQFHVREFIWAHAKQVNPLLDFSWYFIICVAMMMCFNSFYDE